MKPEREAESAFDGLTAEQQERLARVLDSYFNSLEAGQPLDPDQLVSEHPDLAESLSAYVSSLEFLRDAAAGFVAADSSTDLAAGFESGKRLGDFDIGPELGRGGMGVVYQAQQISLARQVALKVLPFASLLDAKQIARFRNEAQAAAQLHHAHIVPVFAVGVERGVHYYAMQLIEGQPLDVAIKQLKQLRPGKAGDSGSSLVNAYSSDQSLYFQSVAKLGIQAAQALHYAHQQGIVHRDVKPSNLLLDEDGKLWITDFGLARCRDDANLTGTGDFLGTMRYMSPEQTTGQSHLVDHRTDVYSLGATLYELLTLHPAVRGDDPASMLRQLDREGAYRPRIWNANIPLDLENIVQKAISKDREDRYESAHALAADLERFAAGKPTLARRPTLAARTGKWMRRHQRSVAVALGVLLLAVAGLITSTLLLAIQKQQTEQALEVAQNNFRQYRSQLAMTHNHLALLHHQNGDAAKAIAAFDEAIKLQREILTQHPQEHKTRRDLAATLNNLSFVHALKHPERAKACLEEALELSQQVARQQPDSVRAKRDVALAHANLGSWLAKQDDLPAATGEFQQAIEQLQTVLRSSAADHRAVRDLAISHNNLGMAEQKLGQSLDAERSFRVALDLLKSIVKPQESALNDVSSLAGVYNNLALVLENQGKTAEAAQFYQQAINLQSDAVARAPQSPRYRDLLVKHYYNHSRVLRELGRWEEAAEAVFERKQLVETKPERLLTVAEDLVLVAKGIGEAKNVDGAERAAEKYLRQAVVVLREALDFGLDLPRVIDTNETLMTLRDQPEVQTWLDATSGGRPTEHQP